MSYSKTTFGKDLFDITLDDIETYFQTEREENLHLEFKSNTDRGGSPKEKEKTILKGICAMLNSEGGIIIWGAPIETKHDSGKSTAIGELTAFQTTLDKDKIINKISDLISPFPVGIKAHFVNKDENYVILIEIEKSMERPHQFDNVYYIRIDGQTRPAPHYLIKALIQSKTFPHIRGQLRLVNIMREGPEMIFTFRKVIYNCSPYNNEINPFYSIVVQPPGQLSINNIDYPSRFDNESSILSNGRPDVSEFDVRINVYQLNKELFIILQFGGQKSPSKLSMYTYNFSAALQQGYVDNESVYLVKKEENKFPTDYPSESDDEKIERIFKY